MTTRSDWFATQAELMAPTEEEIEAATQRVTPAARSRFIEAATALSFAKIRSGDRTPWRDLVEAHRQSEPMRVEVEIVTEDGVPRAQVAYIERGYGLKGDDSLMFSAVAELARAIELIEKEREQNSLNGRGKEGKPGGRPSYDRDEIQQCLERAVAKHGAKAMLERNISWIVDRVTYEWEASHDADAKCPTPNTIRPVIEQAFPEHPKLKKKNSKKPGS